METIEQVNNPREDKLMELEETINSGMLKTILANPKDIEFRVYTGNERVEVYNKGEYICSITRAQWMWFADDESSLNKDFK